MYKIVRKNLACLADKDFSFLYQFWHKGCTLKGFLNNIADIYLPLIVTQNWYWEPSIVMDIDIFEKSNVQHITAMQCVCLILSLCILLYN
jgi:hypothetical protein